MSGLFDIGAIVYDGEKYTVGGVPDGFMDPNSVTWKAISKTDDSLDSLIPDFGDNKIVLHIPSTNDKGEPLKEVADSAFGGGKIPFPLGLVFPDSIEKIGNSAFEDNQLTEIHIPEGLVEIGNSAFRNNQITSLVLPDSLTSIGDYAFTDNQLTSLVLPDSLTSIGEWAFDGNPITSVVIPDSVTSIGDYVFINNPLTEVSIGPNTTYGSSTFPDSAVITVREEVGGD